VINQGHTPDSKRFKIPLGDDASSISNSNNLVKVSTPKEAE